MNDFISPKIKQLLLNFRIEWCAYRHSVAVFAHPFPAVNFLHILHICYTASGNINKFIWVKFFKHNEQRFSYFYRLFAFEVVNFTVFLPLLMMYRMYLHGNIPHIVPFNQVRFFAFKVNDFNCVKQCGLQPMISVLLWNKSENIKFISVNGIIYGRS